MRKTKSPEIQIRDSRNAALTALKYVVLTI